MNKTLSIILSTVSALLTIAVIVLFSIVMKKPTPCDMKPCDMPKGEFPTTLPVAYINVDSLLMQYDFAVNANDALMRKQEDARLKINTQARRLQEGYHRRIRA